MKKLILISLTVIAALGWSSCKKAGLGGDANIVAYPEHHGKAIYGATVYVKFDSEDAPGSGTSGYDEVFEGNSNEDFVRINGLRKGKYYLYAVGYDPAISQAVLGGQSASIGRQDKNEDLRVEISVTE